MMVMSSPARLAARYRRRGPADPGSLGGRIRAARLAAGMPIRELASRFPIYDKDLVKIERNLVVPGPYWLLRAAEVLDLPLLAFFEAGDDGG
jgi:transcriptional regulator with XRE-family HTH domain